MKTQELRSTFHYYNQETAENGSQSVWHELGAQGEVAFGISCL